MVTEDPGFGSGLDVDAFDKFSPLDSTQRVVLNVGGWKYETLWRTLERHPNTRLGKLKTSNFLCYDHCTDDDKGSEALNEFFFDRQPKCFNSILDFYRTGKIHLVDEICPIAFSEELEYWEIDENCLDICCLQKYQKRKDSLIEELLQEAKFNILKAEEEEFSGDTCLTSRKFLWNLFEKPSSSFGAKVISLISIFFILLSTVGLILSTIPGFQDCSYEFTNKTICKKYPNTGWFENDFDTRPPEYSNDVVWIGSKVLGIIEAVSIAWFTIEYLSRLISSPGKLKFLKRGMNVIDLLVILPYYIVLIMNATIGSNGEKTHRVLQVLRVLRIMRIFKLARYSTGLQSLGYTMRKSYKELGLLLLLLSMTILVFSSLAFYVESGQNKGFSSIPAGFWWAVITMTTVGYGDIYPVTLPGKIIGGFCAVCGILVIAFPIPIVVTNFGEFYRRQKIKEKAMKRKMEAAANAIKKKGSTSISGSDIFRRES